LGDALMTEVLSNLLKNRFRIRENKGDRFGVVIICTDKNKVIKISNQNKTAIIKEYL
jgi:hypothetical protein